MVCIVDIPVPNPGNQSEERGVAEAIARNIYEQIRFPLPIVSVVLGEGGGGGALASGATGDVILMLQTSVFSVAPPEGCAIILFKDVDKARDTADALKLRAEDGKALRVVDEIIEEPPRGAHRDHAGTATAIKNNILKHLKKLSTLSEEELLARRYEKYARIGVFQR